MSAEDPGFWKWAAGTIGALLTTGGTILFGYHKYLDTRLDKKADKEDIQEIRDELTVQRGHIGKVFDKLSEAESKNESRHRELLMHLLEKGKTDGH